MIGAIFWFLFYFDPVGFVFSNGGWFRVIRSFAHGRGLRRRFLSGLLALSLCGIPLFAPNMDVYAAEPGYGISYEQAYISDSGEFIGGEFYYRQLSDTQQELYQDLLEGISGVESSFPVANSSWEDLWEAYEAVYWDHEELWWLTGTLRSSGANAEPEYLVDPSQIAGMQAEIDVQANAILEQCPGGSSYDKARYVYQWLVNNVDYQDGCYGNQCIYSALVRRQSVCAGYARASQYLLTRLGVETIYTLGTIDGVSHAWTMVRLGNDWYHMDVTYGDPIVYDEWGNRIPTLDGSNMNWNYFCRDDSFMLQDHVIDTNYAYPACQAVDPAVSALQPVADAPLTPTEPAQAEGKAVSKGELNVGLMVDAFERSIDNGDSSVTLQFLCQEDYDEALNDVIPSLVPESAVKLARDHGLEVAWYRYVRNPEDLTVKVYWSYVDDVKPDVIL